MPTFEASIAVLDNVRLNNQINEALIIWRTLIGYYEPGRGWPHHSTTRMWQGYEDALAYYHDLCLAEYRRRKGTDDKRITIGERLDFCLPPWFGDPALHASHRSNLLRKDPSWYGQYGWAEGPDLPYVWPVKKAG